MTTDTDIRLRSWLDANQRDREQMCRAILAIDSRYSSVRPRHPAGGRDGGRDIEATYNGSEIAFGAVGFANGANDSDKQKRTIKDKFRADLEAALSAKPDLKVFVFMTNIHLTVKEIDNLKSEARKSNVLHCDILDRERLRIELDSPSGFFIRFQFLDIPLSPAEQASFLSKYGDQIQDVVASGFQRVEKTLNRLLFLAEANDVLDGVHVRFVLNKSYHAADIGHFRAFVHLKLREIKHDILFIWFGSSDKSTRFRKDVDQLEIDGTTPGIGSGIAGGQWEEQFHLDSAASGDDSDPSSKEGGLGTLEESRFICVGSSSGVGMDPVSGIPATYSHDDSLIRYRPRLLLRDLDECWFLPVLNGSLAEKLHSIKVFANGYKLADYGPGKFTIDDSKWDARIPGNFTPEELGDPWVRIRPSPMSSSFVLRFFKTTPRRTYEHLELPDTPIPS